MTNKKTKFVQIACCSMNDDDFDAVYALDKEGRVWFYRWAEEDPSRDGWVRLNDYRVIQRYDRPKASE